MKVVSVFSPSAAASSIIVAAAALFCCCLGFVSAANAENATWSNENATSRVFVHIPFEIHNPNGYPHVKAEFGHLSSKLGQMTMQVQRVHTNMCALPSYNTTKEWEHPYLVAVDPGVYKECSYVSKARNAQLIGASGLIVLADQCLCSDVDCMKEDGSNQSEQHCYEQPPRLVNDGSGNDITIPTYLVYKNLKDKMEQHGWSKKQPILMELQWGLQSPLLDANTIDLTYRFWTNAHDPYVDLETYHNLRGVHDAFKDKAQFYPRYDLVDGTRFHCTSNNNANYRMLVDAVKVGNSSDDSGGGGNDTQPVTNPACDQLCTNGGRYCTIHAKELSGHAIVRETLRRLCIWKHYSTPESGPDHKAWWEYTLYHKERCSYDPHKFADHDCVHDALAHAGIRPDLIDQCMTDSGDIDSTDSTNALLQEQLDKKEHAGITTLPAIVVGHQVQELSTYKLFDTICQEYWRSNVQSVPDICVKCGSCSNIPGCLKAGGKCVDYDNAQREPAPSSEGDKTEHDDDKKGSGKKGRSGWRIFMWIVLIGGLGGGGYYWYKKRQEEMNMGGGGGRGGLLNNYMQLGQD